MSKTATHQNLSPYTLPMQTAGIQHLVGRVYREGAPYQWVRETVINALEAGATRVELATEWQGVEKLGVHRRLIVDNGKGMTPDELVSFFNTFGHGGKSIGGLHENFGVGSKTSLLPWNKYGLVVVSWQGESMSMIWARCDAGTGEYGLRLMDATDDAGNKSLEHVVAPFDDTEHGIDWRALRPEWAKKSGTAIVLMGNSHKDHTVLGDPGRDEADIKGISSYLNRRMWTIPEGAQLVVSEYRSTDKKQWPKSAATAASGDRRLNRRNIEGARFFITHKGGTGELAHSGSVALPDGAEVLWYLWKGARPNVGSYAALGGYVAVEYKGELYDVNTHHSIYRQFGISETAVRGKLWLVIKPPAAGPNKPGVYPRTDRNALLLDTGAGGGIPLPIPRWAEQFSDRMPPEIQEAIQAARGGEGVITDDTYRDRLRDRFGSRWTSPRFRVIEGGDIPIAPGQLGRGPGQAGVHDPAGSLTGKENTRQTEKPTAPTLGQTKGPKPAKRSTLVGAIPVYRTCREADVPKGIMAVWQPHDPTHPEGVVLINIDHVVITGQIAYWQERFAAHHGETVAEEVIAVYGECAVAMVAHSAHMTTLLPTHVIEERFRSDEALTMGLLGLMAQEAILTRRLPMKLGKARAAS